MCAHPPPSPQPASGGGCTFARPAPEFGLLRAPSRMDSSRNWPAGVQQIIYYRYESTASGAYAVGATGRQGLPVTGG